MTAIGTQPSDRFDPAARERAGDRCVAALQDLLRIPSVNPPPAGGTGELDAARYLAGALEDAGIPSEVFEPVDGRGSVVARLRGDGTGGEPLLLLSHLDVVPAPPERWTHDPFGGEIADGYLYGRGAVDMKDLTAMELEVMRLLAAETRAAGRDPASDPVPGLTRDVLFASTADEEAGGLAGAGWLAMERPEHLRAAAAINEAGGVSVEIGGRRLYPIQVAEKGYAVYRVTIRGTAGHASMPRTDNAAVLAAEAIRRLAEPLPARLVAPMDAFFEGAAAAIGGEIGDRIRAVAAGEPMPAGPAADRHCAPAYRRAAAALVRDTISPTIVHAGVKYNVIPGEATVEIDCRRLPGTTEEAMHAAVLERLGPDLAAVAEVELVVAADPVVAPAEGLFEILAASILAHDPEGVPLPILAPFATDAKHLLPLGVPSYGFSPLRQPADETYIDRYHGVDERVSVAGLRWGVPVLYDAVRTFCG